MIWTPELLRTPGYPSVIAVLEALTGEGQMATLVLQHVLGITICILAVIACWKFFGAQSALLAACLLAFDVQGIALSNVILTENVYGFLVLCAALIITKLVRKPSAQLAIIAGVLLGLSALVRPTSIALPTMIAVGLGCYALLKRQRNALVAACLLGLVGNAIEASWIIRNGLATGEYTLSCVGRNSLLLYHAAGALARAKDISERSAMEQQASALGFTEGQIRFLPLSPMENSRIQRLAFDVIWRYKREFLVDYTIRSVNTLFGPEKEILTVLGLPWINFGIHPTTLSSNVVIVGAERGGAQTVSPFAWLLLGAQIVWLGTIYILMLRTVLLAARGRRTPVIVWICLSLAIYVIVLSSGSPGDPRLRWPIMPLLVIVAAASFGGVPRYSNLPASTKEA
jgi:4-amino-4-deoxy-L-arabinose transferase-like glycosyltransferase